MASTATILIVDDYAASRYALARMMRQQGYETVETGSGAEFFEALATGGLDLVILDVHLPDANGFELCDQIRSDDRYRELPVIVVSATYTSPDHRERARTSGADAYLEQPVLSEQLAAEVQRLLSKRGR